MGCNLTCCIRSCLWIPLIRYIRIARRTRRDLRSQFELDALNAQNELRLNHGAEALTLCTRFSKTCKAHAKWLADNDVFEHSEQKQRRYQIGVCGENLAEYIIWNEDYMKPDGRRVILDWYKEGANYEYAGQFNSEAGSNC